jgi:DNA invertase Pin-like site-specific DNA recombinase
VVPCVIYAAKSTDDLRGSIASQIADCRAEINRAGSRSVIAVEHDDGASAYKRNRGPGLARAKDRAAAATAGHGRAELWVQHSDRLARGDGLTADHLAEVFFAMRRAGVRLRSVQDDTNLEDVIRVALIGERNTEDSRRKSAATRAGKRRRFESGHAVGGPINDGYRLVAELDEHGAVRLARDGRVASRRERDPERATLIERIFELLESGRTFGDIARLLNAECATTRTGRRWTTRAVREIATNPVYTGQVVMHGERAAGTHPPLIDPVRWQHIQDGLRRLDPAAAQRRKGGRRPVEEYLLRGVGFCSRCESPLYTRRRAMGRTYVCREVREATGRCSAPPIPADLLEAGVVADLRELVPRVEGWLADKIAERKQARVRLEHALNAERGRLHELECDIDALLGSYRRHLRSGTDLSDVALRALQAAEREAHQQRDAVTAAEARLQEWTVAPAVIDSALDYFNGVRDSIATHLDAPDGTPAMRAALSHVLSGVWAQMLGDGDIYVYVSLFAAPGEVQYGHAKPIWSDLVVDGERWPDIVANVVAESREREARVVARIERDTFVYVQPIRRPISS